VFCSRPKALPESYLRYLENELRHDFDLPGVPIRFQVKKRS
jgi:GTP-binding protein